MVRFEQGAKLDQLTLKFNTNKDVFQKFFQNRKKNA
jgi:ribosomal protein S17E